jgi:hypothetical protein
MAKLVLRGFFAACGQVEEVGEKKTKKLGFVLRIPAYVNEFQEVKGKEEHWLVDVLGDKITTSGVQGITAESKVSCDVFVNSFYQESKRPDIEGKPMYFVNVTLDKITVI